MEVFYDLNDPFIVAKLKEINDNLHVSYKPTTSNYDVEAYLMPSDFNYDEVRFRIVVTMGGRTVANCLIPQAADWHTYSILIEAIDAERKLGMKLGKVQAINKFGEMMLESSGIKLSEVSDLSETLVNDR